MAGETFAVINARMKPPFFRPLADALVEMFGLHQIVAIHEARRRPYIFAKFHNIENAQQLQGRLQQQNVPAFVVPTTYFTEPGPAFPINNANCLHDCFEVETYNREPLQVQWGQIAMISYGRVEEREVKRKSSKPATIDGDLGEMLDRRSTRLYRGLVKYDPGPKEIVDTHDVLDIFVGDFRDDQFAAHLRVLAGKFYYDYLAERVQQHSMANFCLLIEDIIGFSPKVHVTTPTRRLLEGRPTGKPHAGFEMFDEFNRWWVAYARARTAEKG